MNTKNQSWYGFLALGIAVVAILLVVWMVKSPSIQSNQSSANAEIVCAPTDIITLLTPNDGENFTPGDTYEIVWYQKDTYTQPVNVNIILTMFEGKSTTGNCSMTMRNESPFIATNVPSVPGKNYFNWTVPDTFLGDSFGVVVSTTTYIVGRQNMYGSVRLISFLLVTY